MLIPLLNNQTLISGPTDTPRDIASVDTTVTGQPAAMAISNVIRPHGVFSDLA